MNKFFYSKLALTNIKKNFKIYFPYIITCTINIAMFFMITALSQNEGLSKMIGADTLATTLGMAASVTGIFSVIFLFYTNSFLVKRRKKEFGLYNILGMEKKHISVLILCETVFIAVVTIGLGLIIGLVLNKLMFLALLKTLHFDVPLAFEISGRAIALTVILFAVIFLLILINNLRQIHLSKPIELLKGGQVGEKEPKTKWIMTLLGVACLSCGYAIAIASKNPLSALSLFFIAVILVILGTYFLFTAGSIAFLKALRKNKKYYYKSNHFVSVSGIMYRMKQNAVGLANICILSTAVLVMISSTLSLYLGMDDILNARYPKEFAITSKDYSPEAQENVNKWLNNSFDELKISPKNKAEYAFLEISAFEEGNCFNTDASVTTSMVDSIRVLFFLTLDDYNNIESTNYTLNDNEILMYSNRNEYSQNTLKIFDTTFNVKEKVPDFVGNGSAASNIASTHYIIVKDLSVLENLDQNFGQSNFEAYGASGSSLRKNYSFDVDSDKESIMKLFGNLSNTKAQFGLENNNVECRTESEASFLGLFGGLFFIGIFLGALFIMATILIIYYKQISEGYDDKERFEIMKKVGMSHKEIKKSIRSQVLTVFFLPLITAGIHIAFAFPAIKRILAVFNLTNVPLFAVCTAACFIIFALLYAVIYAVTARVYYKIVE